jgi:hypothetical protein
LATADEVIQYQIRAATHRPVSASLLRTKPRSGARWSGLQTSRWSEPITRHDAPIRGTDVGIAWCRQGYAPSAPNIPATRRWRCRHAGRIADCECDIIASMTGLDLKRRGQ